MTPLAFPTLMKAATVRSMSSVECAADSYKKYGYDVVKGFLFFFVVFSHLNSDARLSLGNHRVAEPDHVDALA